MCETCEALCKTWNTSIVPGWFLVLATKDGDVMKEGEFGLSNGSVIPPVIWSGLDSDGRKDFGENIYIHPVQAHDLVSKAIETGWNEVDCSLESFLWERIIRISENEKPV